MQETRRRQYRKRRIRRWLVKTTLAVLLVVAAGNLLGFLLRRAQTDQEPASTYTQAQQLSAGTSPEAPKKLGERQIEKELRAMAQKNTAYEEIYQQRDSYPQSVLNALCNNPEMLPFVQGYLQADKKADGILTGEECKEKIPLLLQWDTRWGYASYGRSDIGLSGCAPTCLSMVIIGLTRKTYATPDAIASFAQEQGYYLEGTGTSWSLMTEGADSFGIHGQEIRLSEGTMKEQLEEGHPVICSVGPGDFTTEGHFIVLTGVQDGKIKVNDPNCIRRSCLWDYETLAGQIKNLWAFTKK